MAEKRAETRAKVRLQISFSDDEGSERRGFTMNLSEVGLSVQSTHVFPPGSRVKGQLTLPSGQIVRFTGEVRWSRPVRRELRGGIPSSMGLRFQSRPDGPYLDFVGAPSKR